MEPILSAQPLVIRTDKGLYCEPGGFYIDPCRAVDLAVVTHAHSDHARRGSRRYICERSGIGLLKTRLGQKIEVEGREYGEKFRLGDVTVSLHSAGHILGSAQVRIEYQGEVWVVSGDYKRDPDPSCAPFESVPCHTFITEATFGTPRYRWNKSATHGLDIFDWWKKNASEGLTTIVFGYSLGKGQRILAELAPYADRPILIHDAMIELTECYRAEGCRLAETRSLEDALQEASSAGRTLDGEIVLAPSSILEHEHARWLGEYRTAFASGWMQGGGFRRFDHGFVMSDHADWDDLNRTIRETGAHRVFVQHRNGALVRYLRAKGIEAYPEEALTKETFARFEPRTLDLFSQY